MNGIGRKSYKHLGLYRKGWGSQLPVVLKPLHKLQLNTVDTHACTSLQYISIRTDSTVNTEKFSWFPFKIEKEWWI